MPTSDLQHPNQWADEILRLISAGRIADAVADSQKFIVAFPELAVAEFCLGYALAASGKPGMAFPHLRSAVQQQPNNPDFLARYGQAALEINNILVAEPALNRAIALRPSMISAKWALGTFYRNVARPAKAYGFYADLLASPAVGQDMRSTILAEFTKLRIEAGEAAQVARELRPIVESGKCPLAALVHYLDCGQSRQGSIEEKLLDAALNRRDYPPRLLAKLQNCKAKILHNSGKYEEAYKEFRRSKSHRSEKGDVVRSIREIADAVTAAISRRTVENLSSEFGETEFEPIFVVGLPRSGTTLTETILSSHSLVCGAGELAYMEQLHSMLLPDRDASHLAAQMKAVGEQRLSAIIREIVKSMQYLGGNAKYVVDKMPHNFVHVMLILAVFPRARIVHCFRDPADNFLSTFTANLGDNHRFGDDPETYAAYYQQYARLMYHWYELFPEAIFPLRYEALVTRPRDKINEMLGFLGLDPEDDCFHPERSKSSVRTSSVLQVRNPINSNSLGRWKNYESQLKVIHEKLGPNINSFGEG